MINNLGLGTFETSEETLGTAYNNTKTGFFEAAGATFYNAWNFNPTSSVFRVKNKYKHINQAILILIEMKLNKQYGHLGLVFRKRY